MNSNMALYFKGNWSAEQLAEMGINTRDAFNPYNQMQNRFADQVTHDNLAGEYTDVNGVQSIYYVSSLDTKRDPIYHEDPTQVMERVFHIKMVGDETIAADKIKFGRFVFEGMDEINVFIHRATFFEMNYVSLQNYGIAPLLDPLNHNPIISERGGAQFNYKGYSKAQIFPKATDLIKPDWNNLLYEITDVRIEIPDQSFLQRKYFFGITLRQYRDDHRDIADTVENNGFNTEGVINNKFDRYTDLDIAGNIQNEPIPDDNSVESDDNTRRYWGNPEHPYGVHEGSISKKDTVTYRPETIPDGTKNISDNKRFRPAPFGRA